MPPDMPAAKFRPEPPITTTRPPVMYSHAWSPTPSTTARAPLFRTAKRSPATPRTYASPLVAPYSATFPTRMLSWGANVDSRGGKATILPPDSPLPR